MCSSDLLNFDGVDDYVDCGNKSEFNFGKTPFTISVWFIRKDLEIGRASCRERV